MSSLARRPDSPGLVLTVYSIGHHVNQTSRRGPMVTDEHCHHTAIRNIELMYILVYAVGREPASTAAMSNPSRAGSLLQNVSKVRTMPP